MLFIWQLEGYKAVESPAPTIPKKFAFGESSKI